MTGIQGCTPEAHRAYQVFRGTLYIALAVLMVFIVAKKIKDGYRATDGHFETKLEAPK